MAAILERPSSFTASFGGASSRFVIESNVPVPPRAGGPGREPIYPFAHMRVGDSFEVSLREYGGRRNATVENIMTTLNNCSKGYAKRHNPKAQFTVRKTGDTSARIWRTA